MDWNNILSYAVKKMDKSIKLKDFSHITENGKWVTTKDGYWTGGFLVNLHWGLIDLPIEPLCYTEEEFREMVENNNNFMSEVLKEGVEI